MTLDCQACGACCAVAASPAYVGLTVADVVRLPPAYGGQVLEAPTYRALACPGGRCCALEGQVGESTSCAIYEARPGACRAFEPGGNDCLAARARAGLAHGGAAA